MKKLFIIIIILLMFTLNVGAKLSKETQDIVERLKLKYELSLYLTDKNMLAFESAVEWTYDFLSIWVKDGKLFVETQDGKWYIEMKEIKKGDD